MNVQDLLNATTATRTKTLDATQKVTFYALPAACSALFKQAGAATRTTRSGRNFDVSKITPDRTCQ